MTSKDEGEPDSTPSSRSSPDRPYVPAMGNPRLLPLYDAFARLAGARIPQWRLVAQAGIAPGNTVLEIGAGTGTVLLMAKSAVRSATVVGLDPDPQALALAKRRAARADLDLRLIRGYADRLPYPDGSVDRVLSAFMFHHLSGAEQAAALNEAHRVLTPGGSLHLVDMGGEQTGIGGRLLHWRHKHGDGHPTDRSEPDSTAGRAARRPETPSTSGMVSLLREAGFDGADAVGRRRTSIGTVTFYRADRRG